MKVEVIPAILAYDRRELLDRIRRVKPYVKTIQLDVMDGVFVPNLTMPLRDMNGLPDGVEYEFHWMVLQPDRCISEIKGKHTHIVHYEVLIQGKDTFEKVSEAVKKSGGRLGIAINPETSVKEAFPLLNKVDYILVMSVRPGFSGQKYLPSAEGKLSELRKLFKDKDLEVDGGLNKETAYKAAMAGANKIAAASAIFSALDVKGAVKELTEHAEKGCNTWLKTSSGQRT